MGAGPERVLTAASLAAASGVSVSFAYVDPRRVVDREPADGSVLHSDFDPDLSEDAEWRQRQGELEEAEQPWCSPCRCWVSA